MKFRGSLVVWLLCCGKSQDRVDTQGGDPKDTAQDSGTFDSGGPGPEVECSAGRLELVGEWVSVDFESPPGVTPPEVVGTCGWGMAAVDLNEDGAVDLAMVGLTSPTVPLVNTGGIFEPSDTILFDDGPLPTGNGLAVGDINQDGRPDLVLVRSKGDADRVYMNAGDGRFVSTAIVDSSDESQHASLFDADGDGDLDLFVSRHLDIDDRGIDSMDEAVFRGNVNGFYVNNEGIFSPGPPIGTVDAATFQSLPIDVDVDGDLDLYLVNDFGPFIEPNELLINDGSGGFSVAEDCGCELSMFGMGATASDFDNDGLVDVHVSNFGSPRLLRSLSPGQFVDTTVVSGAYVEPSSDRVTSWGTVFVDIDGDGWDELATVYGTVVVGISGDWTDNIDHPAINDLDDSAVQVNALLHNESGVFEDRAAAMGFDYAGISRAIVKADFDADGIPDLAVAGLKPDRTQFVRLYLGRDGCGPGITIGFPEVSARDIGTIVEWSVGGVERRRWYQPGATFSSSGPTLHLGLAGYGSADWVRLTPLGGETTEVLNVVAGSRLDQRSYP
jgi:hypothetical protein